MVIFHGYVNVYQRAIWINMSQTTYQVVWIPIGSMYAIYGIIYHQYTPNVRIYTSTMDPTVMVIYQL